MPTRPSGRQSSRGIQTQTQILKAARRLFTNRGYHQTSIYNLFKDAGITKGAFFHHWRTKEDLALSILDELRKDFEAQFFSVARSPGRSRDKIEELLRLIGRLNDQEDWNHGRLFSIWCAELDAGEEGIGSAVHELRTQWCGMWTELIRSAQLEHDLRADISAECLSFLVVSTICGVQLMCRDESGGCAQAAFESLRKVILT